MRTRDCVPAELRRALEDLFGDSVDDVVVRERSWFAWLHGRARATTRRNTIYLRGTLDEFLDDPELMLHEYFHVLRQWGTGQLTIPRYLGECFRHGYWDNRFEVEAREFTASEIFRYRALLAQHRTESLPPGVHPIRRKSAAQ